jgi:hypothetical protein
MGDFKKGDILKSAGGKPSKKVLGNIFTSFGQPSWMR